MAGVDQDTLAGWLTRLRLTAIRDQLDNLLDEAAERKLTLREALALFVEREVARKDERRIGMAFRIAPRRRTRTPRARREPFGGGGKTWARRRAAATAWWSLRVDFGRAAAGLGDDQYNRRRAAPGDRPAGRRGAPGALPSAGGCLT